ncbi:MAG: PD-(D/E)XK nuclease family protein [Alphaproteobacteria bacterium]
MRQPHGYHPRLFIMGPIEARLQKADTVVLGGLNEGSWPPITSTDPWLNRPMRSEFGLPLPERRIGLSAHDFSQAFAAEKVVLTRAIKVGGTPTVPSRWLMRLDTVLQASGGLKLQSGEHWRAWYHALDHADSIQPAEMPKPSPALADRPKILSVTRLESLASDPYQFYAQKVLKVSPLDGIEQPLDGAHKGTIVHAILQQIKDDKIDLHAADAYLQCLEVARVFAQPSLWWMRVERLLDWFVTHEQNRPKNIVKTVTEVSGSIQLDDITITAIADRIDIYDNGAVDIIDYKTGFVPSQRDMLMGRSLQLPMEAAIQLWGGFEGVPHGPVNALSFWKVTGGEPAGEEMVLKGNPEELAQTALQHCETLIEQYLDPDMVFAASPFPGPYNVYGQLSRLQEWAA